MARSRSRNRGCPSSPSGNAPDLFARIHPVTWFLWAGTSTPLYEGIFFATAANGQLTLSSSDGIWRSVVFSIACFTGGGAVAGALTLAGPLRQRIASVSGVYLTIAVGILTETGVLTWDPRHMPAFVLLSLVVGFLLTILAAVLASSLTRWLDTTWITRAGVVATVSIALNDLGIPLPVEVAIGTMIGGIAGPPVVRTRFVRRLYCRPRARRIRQLRRGSRIPNRNAPA